YVPILTMATSRKWSNGWTAQGNNTDDRPFEFPSIMTEFVVEPFPLVMMNPPFVRSCREPRHGSHPFPRPVPGLPPAGRADQRREGAHRPAEAPDPGGDAVRRDHHR